MTGPESGSAQVPEYSEVDFQEGGRFHEVGEEIARLTSPGIIPFGGESGSADSSTAVAAVSPAGGDIPPVLPVQDDAKRVEGYTGEQPAVPDGSSTPVDETEAAEPAVASRPANILSGEEERKVRREETDFYRNEIDKRISAFQQGNLHVESLTSFLPWELVRSRYEAGSQELEDAFTGVRNVLTPEEFEGVQGLFYENITSLINGMELPSILSQGGRVYFPGDARWLDQYRRDIIAHPERGIEITNNDEEWNKWVANTVQQTRPEAAADKSAGMVIDEVNELRGLARTVSADRVDRVVLENHIFTKYQRELEEAQVQNLIDWWIKKKIAPAIAGSGATPGGDLMTFVENNMDPRISIKIYDSVADILEGKT